MAKKDENKLWLAHDTRQSLAASIKAGLVCANKETAQHVCRQENDWKELPIYRVTRVEIKEIKR